MSRRILLPLLIAVAAIVSCGSTATTTPTPTPHATATPVPLADTETLTQVSTGVGVFDLVTIPVVVFHNDAKYHAAIGVTAQFTPYRGTHALASLASPTIDVPAGATFILAADCTDPCTGADHTTATLAATSWKASSALMPITVSGTAIQDGGPAKGHGDVGGTLTAKGLAANTLVTAFAACYAPDGSIVGGGTTQVVWTGSATQMVSISFIVSQGINHCDIAAGTGNG